MRYLKIILPILVLVFLAFIPLAVFADELNFLDLVKTGTPEQIKKIIASGADVNARDEDGGTPLMYAVVWNKNPEVIKVLIAPGADVKARDEDGWTPLMYAARFNENPDVIITLLELRSDGKARDIEGKTAFDYAKENKYIKGTKAYWKLNDARF